MPDSITAQYFSGKNCHYSKEILDGFELSGVRLEPDDWRRLAGAPDNSRIEARLIDERQDFGYVRGVLITTRNPMFVWPSQRILYRDADRDEMRVVRNDSFALKDPYQQLGIGLRSFAIEVTAAAEREFALITAEAAGSKTSATFKGWYAWARMGYDAKIPTDVYPRLPEQLRVHENILDLMETQDGRRAWWDCGHELEMTFNLEEHSRSRMVLRAYMQERGCEL